MAKLSRNPGKKERDRLVKECIAAKLKVDRTKSTIKQQMTALGKALATRQKEVPK